MAGSGCDLYGEEVSVNLLGVLEGSQGGQSQALRNWADYRLYIDIDEVRNDFAKEQMIGKTGLGRDEGPPFLLYGGHD